MILQIILQKYLQYLILILHKNLKILQYIKVMVEHLTKKELILQKFDNFIIFLKSVSDKTEEIDKIKNLSVENMLQMYVQHSNHFKNLQESSIKIIIFLDILPSEENITRIKKYLQFFDEILNM